VLAKTRLKEPAHTHARAHHAHPPTRAHTHPDVHARGAADGSAGGTPAEVENSKPDWQKHKPHSA
jgi:hypothetical protein